MGSYTLYIYNSRVSCRDRQKHKPQPPPYAIRHMTRKRRLNTVYTVFKRLELKKLNRPAFTGQTEVDILP